MEEFKEFQGKSLDEAIQGACKYYNTPREKLEIDIVQDAKNGIFGLVGVRKAIVRARRAQLRTSVGTILGRDQVDPPKNSNSPAKNGNGPAQDASLAAVKDTSLANKDASLFNKDTSLANKDASLSAVKDDSLSVKTASASSPNGTALPKEQAVAPRQQNKGAREQNPIAGRDPNGGARDSKAVAVREQSSVAVREQSAMAVREQGNVAVREQGSGSPRDRSQDSRDARGNRSENWQPRPERDSTPRDRSRPAGDATDEGANRRRRRPSRPSSNSMGATGGAGVAGAEGSVVSAGSAGSDGAAMQNTGYQYAQSQTVQSACQAGVPHLSLAQNACVQAPAMQVPAMQVPAGTGDGFVDLEQDDGVEGLAVVPFADLDAVRLQEIATSTAMNLIKPILGEVPVQVTLGPGRVEIHIECGDDSGLLIGREGQTLAALQYLASRIVSRAMAASVRVQIDVGDYRERQDERLRDLALSLAERVRVTGRSCSTRPMSSYHRRIVHLALQEAPDVQTRSSGEGPLKRVIVQRKRQQQERKPV